MSDVWLSLFSAVFLDAVRMRAKQCALCWVLQVERASERRSRSGVHRLAPRLCNETSGAPPCRHQPSPRPQESRPMLLAKCDRGVLPASANKNVPLEKKTGGKTSFQNNYQDSGAGEQVLLLDRRAASRVKGVFVCRRRYLKGDLNKEILRS